MSERDKHELLTHLENQQYGARYVLGKYGSSMDEETTEEIRGQMMKNRLGENGLRSLNKQLEKENTEQRRIKQIDKERKKLLEELGLSANQRRQGISWGEDPGRNAI